MLWVGLTGGIATGKSTVTEVLRRRGIPVVCADELAREVVQKGTEGFRLVTQVFGPAAIASDGELDRKEIGRQVFTDPQRLKELEEIIHPRVRALTEEYRTRLAKQGHSLGFYDVPLLFEKKMESFFDQIVVVHADRDLQKTRALKRDQLTDLEIERRLLAQLPGSEKVNKAHYVIYNNGTLVELEKQVDSVLAQLLSSIKP
jgi:dephospho-CoA kinase